MQPPSVLVSSHFKEGHVKTLRERFTNVDFIQLDAGKGVPEQGRDARVLLRAAMPKEELSRVLREAPVEWLHTSTAGFDWVMVPEVLERQLTVTRSAASYSVPIGEYVVATIFLLAKRFPQLLDAQRRREWTTPEPDEIGGKTVAIVGAGAIGGEVAGHAAGLGMRVIGTKRTPEPLPHYELVLPPHELPRALAEADFLVLACPLTPETRHVIGERELRHMKQSAFLINVGRGALVQQAALVAALEEGWIAGACADAFEQEPLPPHSPLWSTKNLIVTPHSSFRSPRNMERILEEFMINLQRYLERKPLLNRLRDFELGY